MGGSRTIFPNQTRQGHVLQNLTARSLKPLVERASLPRSVRVHAQRQTFATLKLCNGDHPKVVQEILGHAAIGITFDTYSHGLPGMGDGLADAMDHVMVCRPVAVRLR